MATNQSTTLPVATHQMKWVLVFALALDPGPGSPPRKATCTGNTSENRLKSGNLSVKKKKLMECPPLPPKQTLSCLARKPLRSFFPFFFFFFFFLLLLHEVQAQAQVLGSLVPTYRKSGPGQVGISSYRIYIPTTIPKKRRFITGLVNLFFSFFLFSGVAFSYYYFVSPRLL